MDLLFHFRLGDTGLSCDSVEGILTGELRSGTSFTGSAEVSMVPKTKVIKVR
jgi:hypothetical protein